MSANSWIKTAVTIRMDVREPTKKWKNLSEKYVCHWKKKPTTKSWGKSPSI